MKINLKNKIYLGPIFLAVALAFLAANQAQAAVTGTSTAINANAAWRANYEQAVLLLNLNATGAPPENLNSVTITLATTTNATSTVMTTSSFAFVGLARDVDSNGIFDGGDVTLATTTVAGFSTSTTINIPVATSSVGNFLVVVQSAATSTFTDNGYPENTNAVAQQFVVLISTSTGVVASSTNAVLTGATTTAAFSADIHSEAPNAAKIYPSYNSSGGTYSIATDGTGGAGEMGVLNIYNSSTSTTPMATTSLDQVGHASYNLGTTYYPSLWLDVNDVAGNATSSRVQLALSNYKPTVTSLGVFTDRIIMNVSKPLRGDQAGLCSNYLINGSAPNCSGGPTAPYIDFEGNQVVIKNLSLSGTASFSVNGLIQDTNSDQFPLAFSTSSAAVQTASVPTVSSITPNSGQTGNTVTIAGTNFGTATGTVYFSGGFNPSTGPLQPIQASTTAWSNTSITATVPTGAQGGPLQVISSAGMASDVNQSTFLTS